jgi:hypothetical protein
MEIQDAKFIDFLLAHAQLAKDIRRPWENKWKKILNCVDPFDDSIDNLFTSSRSVVNNPSPQRTFKYRSSIGALVRNSITMLSGQLVDPSIKWLHLDMDNIGNTDVEDNEPIKKWRKSNEDFIYNLCSKPKSNFYTSSQSLMREWATIGTGCQYVHTNPDGSFRFDCIPMNQVAINVNGLGETTFICRDMMLTGWQALQMWGPQAIDEQVNIYDNLTLVTVKKSYSHIVIENMNQRHPGDFRYLGYVIDNDRKVIVAQMAYYDFPYIISRFLQNSGDIYGRSLLWYLVDEIEYMDHIIDTSRTSAEHAIKPAIAVQSGYNFPINGLNPGHVIRDAIDMMGRLKFQPVQLGAGVNISEQIFALKRQDIIDALPIQTRFPPEVQNMSATEAAERALEQDNKIKPIVTRWEKEALAPLVHFILSSDIAKAKNPFPYLESGISEEELPMPVDQLDVRYSGLLGKQQEKYDSLMLSMIMQELVNIAQVVSSSNPDRALEILELIKADEIARFKIKAADLPNDTIASREEIEAFREAQRAAKDEQARQAQEQQALQNEIDLINIQKQVGIL